MRTGLFFFFSYSIFVKVFAYHILSSPPSISLQAHKEEKEQTVVSREDLG